ncbi:hypothetical protein LZ023_40730 (plasmid) [Pseudomonas silvicola]|nr:hypothetical protein LZ023_41005 [Pseudomonas silvicola]WAH62261.1 hypothetical protein LZ023_40730 [Pseudomonas silvicola]
MSTKTRYDALIPHEYESNGEKKTYWTRVGAAWSNADGKGINIELTPGLSVHGKLVLRIPDQKTEGK